MNNLAKGFLLGVSVSFLVLTGILYSINKNKEKFIKARVNSIITEKIDSIFIAKRPWIDSVLTAHYTTLKKDSTFQKKWSDLKIKTAKILTK